MQVLKKRADFLSVAKGGRVHKSALTLQFKDNLENEARFGFTVTKKLGNAVVRNRVKRRLRAAVKASSADNTHLDVVLIGRLPALTLKFNVICQELQQALRQADKKGKTYDRE
jgi:ribonuclease P protein component